MSFGQIEAGATGNTDAGHVQNQYIASLRWLTHFAIFSLVPLTEEISYSSVAASAGVSERQLKTVARMAMTNRVLCEPTPGMIAHTATSATFVTNPSLHDWAIFMCEASVPAAAHMVEASKKWPDSSAPNETAYNVAFDTNLPFFDHLATLPIRTKQFAGYMKNVTNSEGTAIRHLLNGFNWAGLGTAHVVDVGGSTGNSSIALAQVFPNLRFTVQDLPGNVTEGAASLAHYESSISSRIEFRNHDFFQPQPVIGADVFLLRMILHDWATPEAMKILRNLLPALRGNSRVLIMDTVLPPPGSLPSTQERMLRARDMTMQQVFNSMERDLQDWEALLAMADERLELVNVVHPSGSVMSILEVVLRG
ncbi:o-methyltransferase [Aspergillus sclerotialis]|uniref:O-methyltransferase n=1 Tax=Aspergillus sclerotialis TaxID=2070753 RepID=A0A3A2ZRD5_9EURO|nr:o-methyltransferase [Aspergillus sclerotialis]